MSAAEFIINDNFDFTPYKRQESNGISLSDKPCILCLKPSTITCPECQKFHYCYCGVQHQKSHWKTHQFDCPGPRNDNNNDRSSDLNLTKKSMEKANEKEKESSNNVKFQDGKVDKLNEEREKLRKELISLFMNSRFSETIPFGQKLVKTSLKIYELANKRDSREFYEYCADHLLLVRGLIKNEQIQSARDNLIMILPMVTRIIDRNEKFKEIAKTTDISSMEFINVDVDVLGYHKKLLINNELKRRANLLSLVASALFNVEDHKNCEMLFVKYVKLIEKNYGTKSLEMSNCYFMIGGFYYQLDMFPKALESFKRSFEVRKAKLGEKHESVGDCWYNMALVYKHMGKMIKAILILEKAYDQRKEAKGEISLPCALVLEVLGKVFLENGNYKASLMKFQECYNVRKKILNNAKHPELIRISLLIMHLQKMINDLIIKKGGPVPVDRTTGQLQEIRNNFSTHNSKERDNNPKSKPYSIESFSNLKMSPEKNNLNTSIQTNLKNKGPVEEVDEEHVFLMQPVPSTSGRFHKKPYMDQGLEMNFKGFDLPLDEDFLASLSIEQLVRFSEMRKRITATYIEIDNIAEEILNSDFIKSLNGLQYNTFMLSLKKYLNKKIPTSLTHENPFNSIYKSLEEIKHIIKLQPVPQDTSDFNNRLSDSLETKNHIFSINSNRPTPKNKENASFNEQIKPHGDRIRMETLPKGDGERNPFYDYESKNGEEVIIPKVLIPVPSNIFQKVKPPQVMLPPENLQGYYNYQNYLNQAQQNPSLNTSQLTPQINPHTGEYEYVDPYRISLGSQENIQQNSSGIHRPPPGGVALFGNPNNQNSSNVGQKNFLQPQAPGMPQNYYVAPSGQMAYTNPHQMAFYQNQGSQNNLVFQNQDKDNSEGSSPMEKSPVFNNSQGSQKFLQVNQLGGIPNFQSFSVANSNSNFQQGVGDSQINMTGDQNLMNSSLKNYQDLMTSSQGKLKLIGEPPLLGGPPLPPNLFGGPPLPPNLIGGPPGPPNLLGGPKLLGPPLLPGMGPPKIGGLPGLGGKLGTVVNLGPKSKTKPLFWETLPAQQLGNSIWNEANKLNNEEIKFDDLEEIFENASPTKTGPSAEQEKKKPELICLITDEKKVYNLNMLMLSKFKKFSMDQLKNAILNLDSSILSLEAAQALLKFPPEAEEMNVVKGYDGSMEALDLVSQFYLTIKDIPRYQPRLKTTILRDEFDDRFNPAVKDIDTVEKACQALKNNENFKRFLKLVLDLGNKMNSGTNRGNAMGFKMSSLMTLMSLKSNKDSRTLFQYIMEKIHEQKPEILDFYKEFEILTDAAKINIEDRLKELDSLQGQINALKNNIDACQKTSPPDMGFVEAFREFKDKNLQRSFESKEKAFKIKSLYIEIAKLYGEDDSTLMKKNSGEFFGTLVGFNDKVKKFLKDIEEKKIKEEKAAKLKK